MSRFALALAIVLASQPTGAAMQAAQSGGARPASSWPRMDDAVFSIIAPVDKLRTSGASPLQVLAELDRLQSQISTGPIVVQARAMYIRGLMLRVNADLPGATKAAVEARALAAKANHPVIEADALLLQVEIANDRGDLAAATARLDEARRIAESSGDAVLQYNVRLEQGRIARSRGRNLEALPALVEAAAIGDRVQQPRMQIQPRLTLSSTKLGLSDYGGALADAQDAYALAAPASIPTDLKGAAALGLAQALSQIGDLESGLELYSESIDAYGRMNFVAGVALAVRQRMDARFTLGDVEGAAEDGDRALQLFAKSGSQGQLPAVLSRMALIAARLGRTEAASDYAQQASTRLAGSQPRVRAQIEGDLANAALARRQFADAAAGHARLLDQARTLRDPDLEWRALQGLGRAALGVGDLPTAQARFEASVTVIDRLRRTLPDPGLRADFVAERLEPYDGLIATLMARATSPSDASTARAFEIAEQARGRALADLLAEARSRATDPAIARIRTAELDFGKRISALQQAIGGSATEAERRKLVADLNRVEQEFNAFVVRIRRENPRYAALAHSRVSTVAELSRTLAGDEALVSFWIGGDRGVAWMVTRAGVRSYHLPGRRDVDRDVARLRSAVAGGQAADVRRIGSALHSALFPFRDARIKRLIIVPDGPLWRLPFGALSTGVSGPWLVEQVAFSVVPSASVLSSIAAPSRAARPAVVFGLEQIPASVRALRALYDQRLLPDRPLSFAVSEARAVGTAVAADPGTVFLNERADEASFKKATAAPVRIVHVAAHALIDDRVPRRTSLVLAPGGGDDGLLQLNEIANLQLDVDLVVLSTCQSQLGRALRGEGLESLSRAFLHSGARGVVASTWAVDDRETARLMPFLYASLRAGLTPVEALRTAQLRMIQSGGASASPASWAGFVIMGQGGRPLF